MARGTCATATRPRKINLNITFCVSANPLVLADLICVCTDVNGGGNTYDQEASYRDTRNHCYIDSRPKCAPVPPQKIRAHAAWDPSQCSGCSGHTSSYTLGATRQRLIGGGVAIGGTTRSGTASGGIAAVGTARGGAAGVSLVIGGFLT